MKMTNLQLNNDRNNNNEFICGVVEGFYGKPWSCDQRKDLFKRLKKLNLNAFMYAPKDDTKHRAKWRQMYSDQECNQLKSLIDEAKANNINFYYSLAPGLDMIYSDQNEIDLLIRKFDQLVSLGCKSFAILFDDIEPTINQKDREIFESYAAAQVSVTNMIYEHLNRPKFLFCPTEYCESRAIPTVTNSNYLKTLGNGLHPDIDIMWSGSRVISRLITEESIETLSRVIKRPPVIWENLHANDYDKKRIFLGPYSGRSTKIIPKLRGVLTNPNCEYEANYIAIHTLAQWSKCTEDVNLHNRCNPIERHLLNESISFDQINKSVYDPYRALTFAIKDWLPHVLERKYLPSGTDLSELPKQRNDEAANEQLAKQDDNLPKDVDVEVEVDNVEMMPDETQPSPSGSQSTNKSEMDTSSSPVGGPTNVIDTNSCDSCDMQDANDIVQTKVAESDVVVADDKRKDDAFSGSLACATASKTCPGAHVTYSGDQSSENVVNFENLNLLVDLFYLPFEHGSYGYTLLKDIKWLRDNSGSLNYQQSQSDKESKEASMNEEEGCDSDSKVAIDDWLARAEKLNVLCTSINRLVNTLIYNCPNKLLIIELYPYLADMRDATTLIVEYIKFLRYRTSAQDHFRVANNYNTHKDQFTSSSEEQEPWAFRGGLIGDVQRLIS